MPEFRPKGNTYRKDATGPAGERRRQTASMVSEAAAERAEKALAEIKTLHAEVLRAAKKTRPIYVGPGVAPAARGNARVFNETRQNEYLEHRRTGRAVSAALKLTGVTMTDLAHVRKVSPAFVEAEKTLVQERADDLFEEWIAYAREHDPKQLKDILSKMDPERFGEKKVVEKTVTRIAEVGPTLASIAELQARLTERRALSAGGQSAQSDDVIDVEVIDND